MWKPMCGPDTSRVVRWPLWCIGWAGHLGDALQVWLLGIGRDPLVLYLLYAVSFVAVDPVGLTYYLGAGALAVAFFPSPRRTLPPTGARRRWLLVGLLTIFPLAAALLNRACPFPLGGFASYQYVQGDRSGIVSTVPGALWASLAVVALVWRLWPRSAAQAPGKGLRWMVLLCLALTAPILLRKLMEYDGLSSLMNGAPTRVLGLTVIVQFGVVATLEELYFRGCLFDAGRRTMGAVRAALLSSTVFMLAHVGQIAGLLREPTFSAAGHLLQVFALGCVLCLIYHRCGSLWPAIFYHGFLNASSSLAVWAGRIPGSGG